MAELDPNHKYKNKNKICYLSLELNLHHPYIYIYLPMYLLHHMVFNFFPLLEGLRVLKLSLALNAKVITLPTIAIAIVVALKCERR